MLSDLWARVAPEEVDLTREYTQQPPVKVGELAKALGLEVVRSPLKPGISGLIQPAPGASDGFEIRVNKFESRERQRFTVAHEIAHFLLHRDSIGRGVVDTILYRSQLTSKKEAEANRLAADILMPLPVVERELQNSGCRRDEEGAEFLASIFGVSGQAMKIRLGLS